MIPSVVVTDGDERSALAIVRSLGRAGYRVHVCATHAWALAGASRHAATFTVTPDPLADPAAFAEAVAQVVRSTGSKYLLPVSEAALLAVLASPSAVGAEIPFASLEAFDALRNKLLLLEAAQRVGIAVPGQSVLASRDSPLPVDGYPRVLKPARSVGEDANGRAKLRVEYAASEEACRALVATLPDAAFPVLCQQRIEGPGTAVSLLIWDAQVRAAFAHERLREKPPSGGVSVLRRSIPLDEALLQKSVALLREFDWRGVAMVEFKVEASTGRSFLMEVNGRFWGSLQLAIDSGVDFPRLLLDCAEGRSFPPVIDYGVGVRTQWEFGELDHLLTRLTHSDQSLSLPANAPSRLRTIRDIVSTVLSDVRHEVLSRDDPKPFLREAGNWLRRR